MQRTIYETICQDCLEIQSLVAVREESFLFTIVIKVCIRLKTAFAHFSVFSKASAQQFREVNSLYELKRSKWNCRIH